MGTKWMSGFRRVGLETPVKYTHRNGHWSSVSLPRGNVSVEDVDLRVDDFWVEFEGLDRDNISQGKFVE